MLSADPRAFKGRARGNGPEMAACSDYAAPVDFVVGVFSVLPYLPSGKSSIQFRRRLFLRSADKRDWRVKRDEQKRDWT